MTKKTKRIVKVAVLLVLYAMLMAWGMKAVRQLAEIYPTVSLRYAGRITAGQAQEARRYAAKQAQNREENVCWPTFWAADSLLVQTDGKTQTVPAVVFDGKGRYAWNAELTEGSYPGVEDTEGCAVSEQLAWQLWGGTDIVGMPLTIAGRQVKVRGVFKAENPLLLWGVGSGGQYPNGWQNVELGGLEGDSLEAEANGFATASGLGQPQSIVVGGYLGAMAVALLSLPLIMAAAWGMAGVYKHLGRQWRRRAKWLVVAAGMVLALCLPQFLSWLPGWLIPTKWSDFQFWGSLMERISQWWNNWLMLVPFAKDAAAKTLLIRTGWVSAVCLLLVFCIARKMTAAPEEDFQMAEPEQNQPERIKDSERNNREKMNA